MTDRQSPEDRSPFPPEIEGGGVVLTLTPNQLYVTFTETPPLERDTFLAQYRLEPVLEKHGSGPRSDLNAVVLGQRWLQSATGENTAPLIAKIRADDRVATATPVYHRADLLPAVTGLSFADHLLVRFQRRSERTRDEISALIEAMGVEDVESMPDAREGPLHLLRLRDPKRQEVFEIVQGFAQSPLVRYAGPDWIQLHSALCATPNDPLFSKQWNLTRIKAPAGWDIEKGSDSIIIAILDADFDLAHPDLVAKYVPAADQLDLLGIGILPDPTLHHGTACAGIAAAEWNNKIGVAGVAPDCLIMPIRCYEKHNLIESNLVRAIDWAVDHGADVISMSWTYTGLPTNVDHAISHAHREGLVLVASSGNCVPSDTTVPCLPRGTVAYPASNPWVIAVGACDLKYRRHDLDSKDKDGKLEKTPWESNYGPELSVVAPSPVDYTTIQNNNWADFWGTSAAAPQVAGLAALLLSFLYRPSSHIPKYVQMNQLVRSIIEETSMQVGPYSYDKEHPNGTWNEEMGYGQIDVAQALRFARDRYTDYLLEHPSMDYAEVAKILFGLTSGGGGVVYGSGKQPVPVDPGWQRLTPLTQHMLLGLALTELARGVNDPEAHRALEQAGREAMERAARQIGHD